jgi:hypothetical protein
VVAHACNPSYSGGRDQEDCSSKPVWVNSSRDPILKNPLQQRAGGMVKALSSSPNTAKKTNTKKLELKCS